MPCGWLRKKPARCKANGNPSLFRPPNRGVARARRILPKAVDDAEVRACLKLLAGRRHQVITAVALIAPDGRLRQRAAQTRVSVLRLTDDQMGDYIESREGVGKAGGYAIQGRA